MKKETNPRYAVEQRLLPEELYSSGPMLLSKIIGDANPVMQNVYKKAGAEATNSFFETHKVFYLDFASVLVIRVDMPEPSCPGECRAAYFCYCDRNGENLYFTSEKDSAGAFVLCCIPEGSIKHILCGKAPENTKEEMELVAKYYKELVFENGLKQLESLCAG